MKITDLYESEFLTDKDEIIEWMNNSFIKFNPNNLTIEPDGLVCDGDLTLAKNIKMIKVQFKSVDGWFNCSTTNLASLKGCPKIVEGYFSCRSTDIISLEGCPEIVNGYFSCHFTNITSLKYCPKFIGYDFSCFSIKIVDPREYRFALYCDIGHEFKSDHNQINEIINTYSGSFNRKYWAHAINLLSKVQL